MERKHTWSNPMSQAMTSRRSFTKPWLQWVPLTRNLALKISLSSFATRQARGWTYVDRALYLDVESRRSASSASDHAFRKISFEYSTYCFTQIQRGTTDANPAIPARAMDREDTT